MESKQTIGETLEQYAWWLLFCVLLSVAFYQAFVTLNFLTFKFLQSDWRPLYWTTYTISGLSRLFILLFGITWLVVIGWSEAFLRLSRPHQRMRGRALRMIGSTIVLFFISYAILWIWP